MDSLAEGFGFDRGIRVDVSRERGRRKGPTEGTLVEADSDFSRLRFKLTFRPHVGEDLRFSIREGPLLLASGTGRVERAASRSSVEVRVADRHPPQPQALAVRLAPFMTEESRRQCHRRYFSESVPLAHLESWVASSIRLSQLVQVSARINSSATLECLLAEIMEAAKKIMDADASSLLLLDSQTGELIFTVPTGPARAEISGIRIPAGKGFAGWVAKTGLPLVVDDPEKDDRFFGEVSKSGFRTRNLICVPMRDSEGKTLGVLQALNRRKGRRFTEEDLPLFSSLSDHAAIAIEKARLHREALEKQKLERDLSLARSIQAGFLPKEVPQVAGFEIAGMSEPATHVGGDYYDILPLEDRGCALVIADISGKGLSAALLMASLRAALRTQVKNRLSVEETVQLLNNTLTDDCPSNRFVTLFYGELDAEGREFHYVNAGHNPPLLFGSDALVTLEEGGPILGFRKDLTFDAGIVHIAPGQTLVMYTDGVVEAQNHRDEMFGEDRLRELVARHSGLSAAELLGKINDELVRFVGEAPQYDDLTLLIVKSRA